MKILLGSYTENIGLLDWRETGFELQNLPANPKPSWLVSDTARDLLFVVEEDDERGKLHSYRLRGLGKSAVLERLDSIETRGGSPCHILCIAERRLLCVANYNGGPVSIFTYQDNGSLTWLRSIEHHLPVWDQAAGSGANSERQEMSHPHSCILAADGQGIFCADLGYNRVYYHSLNPGGPETETVLPAGYGPRHMCLSADGGLLYVLCELEPYLLSFQAGAQGRLKPLDTCRVTRQVSESHCSEICRHPSLPYLYAGNRGAGYAAQIKTGPNGKLEFVAEFALAGGNPRHIALSPDARFFFAALQNSGQVQVLSVQPDEGTLLAHSLIPFPKASCIHFLSEF